MALFHFSNPASDKPNNAKSYFTGSSESYKRRLKSNSSTAFQSDWERNNNPNIRAVLPEWTSRGMDNCEELIPFHNPKSTPRLSLRTIHRKNMLMRFAVLFLSGLAMCFKARCDSLPTKMFLKYSMPSLDPPRENPLVKSVSIPPSST